MDARSLDQLCVNTLRFLAVDAVQAANSGHPGLPLDAAPMAYVLWSKFLRHNPKNPGFWDRDRFVLSAGHGSALLYALLHVSGYDLSLDELKRFRQWGSRTPGHPEAGLTPGVDVTTGPLGQGLANAVGLAAAEAHLAARYNRPGHEVVKHCTYALVSDGDLMEGVTSEASSLAGHWQLGRLIVLYDDNQVTLAGSASITSSDDVEARYTALGWHVQRVADGNDLDAIERCLRAAVDNTTQPSLICVRTILGYGSPNKQGKFAAHGSPLGAEEVAKTKQSLGWPVDAQFLVPEEARAHFAAAVTRGEQLEAAHRTRWQAYQSAHPQAASELERRLQARLPADWQRALPSFAADAKGMATRKAAGKVLQALAEPLPELIGGSGDLDPSTDTALPGHGDFGTAARVRPEQEGAAGGGWSYAGRNVHFGVREHAMGCIVNGFAYHGGCIGFGATFLAFSDYMRPAIRMAALAKLKAIFVFTHDSVGLGEDGPTHQPIAQLAALRALPNLLVIRPADANETKVAWQIAIETEARPTALVLSRQNLPTLDRTQLAAAEGVRRGGYVLREAQGGAPQLILIATGSEVSVALAAAELLAEQGTRARVVSLPCARLFDEQPAAYREQVLPARIRARIAVEAASPLGWERYTGLDGAVIALDHFGASAPGAVVLREYGFTAEHVAERARSLLSQ
jgi:transketolase